MRFCRNTGTSRQPLSRNRGPQLSQMTNPDSRKKKSTARYPLAKTCTHASGNPATDRRMWYSTETHVAAVVHAAHHHPRRDAACAGQRAEFVLPAHASAGCGSAGLVRFIGRNIVSARLRFR